jgi:hypothetical protein
MFMEQISSLDADSFPVGQEFKFSLEHIGFVQCF